jgi:deferrochelatase/peroxidase EfeB
VADAQAGRAFLRRLTPHVDSAVDWWQPGQSWISVAVSYAGLAALGLPEDSLQSFPEAFRAGMAARAGQLLDYGDNDPKGWDAPFGSGLIHIGVSVFSDSESTWRRTMEMARRQYEGFPGLTVLLAQDFGAQPGDLNPLGYRDSIGQPAIEGSGVDPLPGQGQPVNPRDTKLAILTDVNVHRIIRRSTTYGAPYDPDAISAQDDQTPHGLYFIFISAKAMATLEFLQQEWINNGNFMSLGEERDPNVGLQQDGATFTIPQEPVRRRIHGIETFNVLRGGEYFFLPSLSALRWLAALAGPDEGESS